MNEPRQLEWVIADIKAELDVVKRTSGMCSVDYVTKSLKRIENAADEYCTWVSEMDAGLQSGKSRDWLRNLWRELEPKGHARMQNGRRFFRQLLVPYRKNHEEILRVQAHARATALEEPVGEPTPRRGRG